MVSLKFICMSIQYLGRIMNPNPAASMDHSPVKPWIRIKDVVWSGFGAGSNERFAAKYNSTTLQLAIFQVHIKAQPIEKLIFLSQQIRLSW